MSELCKWLHEQLEQLPLIKYPFFLKDLPENGIYFFYEEGEIWGHSGDKPRIVRIGTHRGKGNFRNRIREHYLLNEKRMCFDKNKPKPSDRSIFRKNIGSALLNRENDNYLSVWNIDFTTKKNRESCGHMRNIEKEKQIELKITEILRKNFSFRFIIVPDDEKRKHLEKALIGTIASCNLCRPSCNWLGKHSPIQKIQESGLWLVKHLKDGPIGEEDKKFILDAIEETKRSYKADK